MASQRQKTVDKCIEDMIQKVQRISPRPDRVVGMTLPCDSKARFRAALTVATLIQTLKTMSDYEGLESTVENVITLQYKIVNDEFFGPNEISYSLYAALGVELANLNLTVHRVTKLRPL